MKRQISDNSAEPDELPLYRQHKLKRAREDVTVNVRGTPFEKVLAYGLFVLEELLDQAERESSLARERGTRVRANGALLDEPLRSLWS